MNSIILLLSHNWEFPSFKVCSFLFTTHFFFWLCPSITAFHINNNKCKRNLTIYIKISCVNPNSETPGTTTVYTINFKIARSTYWTYSLFQIYLSNLFPIHSIDSFTSLNLCWFYHIFSNVFILISIFILLNSFLSS